MKQLPHAEYARRRQRLAANLGPEAALLLMAAPQRPRSHDTPHPYRASSDLRYLTGMSAPESAVLFLPGHPTHELTLFVRPRDPHAERWMGRRLGPEGAKEAFRADAAYPIGELDQHAPGLLEDRTQLYHALGEDPALDARVQGWVRRLRGRRRAPPVGPTQWLDPRETLRRMRLRKSPAEVGLMRRIAELSADAHTLAMRACRPGMYEYELEALLEYDLARHGARDVAYPSIVGAGANATILHYTQNDARMNAGDLVLIDAGGELQGYAADITRTFPVDGRFTAPQRALYQGVLDAQVALIELCQPGRSYDEITNGAQTLLTEAMLELGLLQGSLSENLETKSYQKYYPHTFGHWLGMDVHDPSPYFDDQGQWQTLEQGMVVTIEPGIYVPLEDHEAPEAFRGLGVRIEDDVLVTEHGHDVLTHACPKTIDELEAIIGSTQSLTLS